MRSSRSKNIIWTVGILAITAIFLALFYVTRLSGVKLDQIQTVESQKPAFTADLTEVSGIRVSVDQRDYDAGEVSFRIVDADEQAIFETTGVCGVWEYGERIDLETPLSLTPGESYTVESDQPVSIRLYGDPVSFLSYYLVICALILGILTLCLATWLRGFPHLRVWYLVISVLLMILTTAVAEPLSVPDEPTHFSMTYYLAGRLLGQDDNGVVSITESGLAHGTDGLSYTDGLAFFTDYSTGNEIVPDGEVIAEPAAEIPVYCYLPGAAGIIIAKVLHLPWQWILMLGRFTNGLFGVLILLLACKVCPRFRYYFMGFGLLPSVVWLLDSYSYDVFSLSLTALFFALIMRLRERGQMLHLRDLILPGIVLILYAPIKYVYVLLALCIVLIPRKQWKKIGWMVLLIALLVVGCMAVLRGREALSYLTSSSMDTRSDYAGNGYDSWTVGYVIRHPLYTLLVIANTFLTTTQDFLSKMIAGETQTPLPFVFLVIGVILLLLLVSCGARGLAVRKRDRVYSLVLFVLGCLSVYAAFLFLYSGIPASGVGTIAGMQGRYFLPFLPLLAVGLHSDRLQLRMDRLMEASGVSTEQGLLAGFVVLNLVCELSRVVLLTSV